MKKMTKIKSNHSKTKNVLIFAKDRYMWHRKGFVLLTKWRFTGFELISDPISKATGNVYKIFPVI